jgi:hypothetical protein
VRFKTNARRVHSDDEDNVLTMEESPKSMNVERGRVFIERWKARAGNRRARLARELLGSSSLNSRPLQDLNIWLRNLEARKLWLEARLEHTVGLESIVRAAVGKRTTSR